MSIEIFNRYENKYLLNHQTYTHLLHNLQQNMRLDTYNPDGKMYKIYNLYYDTADNSFIRTCLEKPVFREKIRLRSYEIANKNATVYAEIKHKYDGLVNKRRTAISLQEAQNLFSKAETNPQTLTNPQVFRELAAIIEREPPLTPKVHISYERLALFDRQSDELRISFDHAITTRRRHLDLTQNSPGQPLLPIDQYVMEVKVRWTTPLWLVKLIHHYQLNPIGFSKYGREYLKNLKENYYV